MQGEHGMLKVFAAGGAVVLVLLLLLSLVLGGSIVQAGHVGVLTTFGKVEPGVLQPGFHLRMPGAQSIVQLETRVVAHDFKQIDAASQELQTVKLTGTMNYHLDVEHASELYQNVGPNFADRIIDPAFNDFIKEVVPQYAASTILAHRDEIRRRTKDALGANLARYGIIVDDIYLSNVAYSDEYQKAIEAKQTAQQNVETERQILAQKSIQADQAEAQALGEARARVARATGEAEANDRLTASINPLLVDYQRWLKWDGRMPQVTGGNPLIEIPLSQPTPPTR
jgi:regulator of protease activity HflC (stomatin/prohibitin superfamily)